MISVQGFHWTVESFKATSLITILQKGYEAGQIKVSQLIPLGKWMIKIKTWLQSTASAEWSVIKDISRTCTTAKRANEIVNQSVRWRGQGGKLAAKD